MKSNSKKSPTARLAVALAISLVFPTLPAFAPPEIVHKPFGLEGPPRKGSLMKLWKSGSIAVTFPTPMVALDKVSTTERALEQPCPIVLDPPLDVHWKWVSQTEGELRPPINYTPRQGVAVRRIMYRAKLRKDLRDVAGKAVDPQNWGAQFADDSFALSGVEFLNVVEPPKIKGPAKEVEESEEPNAKADWETANDEEGDDQPKERSIEDPLPARPRVRLEFSRDVKLDDVAKAVLFEDNISHERFPIEVNVEGVQTDSPQGWVVVEPVKPLPPGRNFLLVMERISSSSSGEQLPRQRVLPAGKTNPITIKVVAGYNQPVKGAFIRVRASKPIDPESATPQSILIEPSIAKLKIDRDVRNGRTIELLGDFDTTKAYKVTLKAGLKSVDQFELEKDSVWTARFSRKRPAIISRQPPLLFQRATAASVLSSFLQVNTGKLEWNLATIPPQKLPEIRARLREFGEPVKDRDGNIVTDKTKGEDVWKATQLLIPTLRLPVAASGTFDVSDGDRETTRKVTWNPGDNKPGLYLLEISGKDSAGRIVGNRTLISRSDWVVTAIHATENFIVRIAGMSDGKPMQGIPVQILGQNGNLSGAIVTDVHGEASFAPAAAGSRENPSLAIVAGGPGHQCIQLLNSPNFSSGPEVFFSPSADQMNLIVLDRNLYRPGEVLKFKGFSRKSADDRLSLPRAGEEVTWKITSDEKTIHTGKAVLSKNGSWEGEWQVPVSALGQYEISVDNEKVPFGVAEFRPLPFSVVTETSPTHGDTASLKITSAHFHGAPNANAKIRWTAGWLADSREEGRDQLTTDDQHSPDSPARGFSSEVLSNIAKAGWDVTQTGLNQEVGASESVSGEDTLDENGTRTIVCKSPFRPGLHPRAHVTWTVEVISAAAQVVPGVATTAIQCVPKILGVKLEPAPKKTDALTLTVKSLDVDNKPANGLAAKAEIFRVTVSTVKERLASNLNRYRNSPKFEKVWEKALTTPAEITVPVDQPGRYVVRVTAPSQPNTPQVSESTMVAGYPKNEEDAAIPVPVESDTGLSIKPERARYASGETAMIALETPITGMAHVSVVTDRVLWRDVVPIKSNNERIPIPLLPSFAPNAHVCVHLIKAAGEDGIPAERYGTCELRVDRVDRVLEVSTQLARDIVQPGENVSGVVRVKLNGKPLANADVLLFAVDDAVLELGKWTLPDFTRRFFPDRGLQVSTGSSLSQYAVQDEAGELSRSQKGFILGASGLLKGGPVLPFRKYFKALAFWQPSAPTNSAGELPFQFPAPESLTRYRVVAIVQHDAEQFGAAETRLQLAKSLQVEPALPDFLRIGDEVLLRTVVRQDFAPSDEIDVSVEHLGSAIQLSEPATKRVTVKKGQPVVVGFRGKVMPGSEHVRVVLSATSATQPKMQDGEDNTLKVRPAEIELRETVPGVIAQGKPLDLRAALPARWQQAPGSCDVFLSGSRYLPKLAGLFTMLESEGSIEKLSARMLAATLLADTMKFLPLSTEAGKKLRTSIEEGVRLFDNSNLSSFSFEQPCWPGGDSPNDFVTVQTAWALFNADRQGILVNPELKRQAESALEAIVEGRGPGVEKTPLAVRCFALMVLGHDNAKKPETEPGPDEMPESPPNLTEPAVELFNKRKGLSDEGSAWLALGMYYLHILPKERALLLTEITRPVKATDFDPVTFGSKKRAEAICLFAQCEMASTNWSDAKRRSVRDALEKITESSVDPSTQENLWLLVVFNSLIGSDIPPQIDARRLTSPPPISSKNQVSVAWLGVQLPKFSETFPKPLEPKVQASYLFRASYTAPASAMPPRSQNFALERHWQNLTDPKRLGTAEAPWKLGDQVLVTYQLTTERAHSYVEVEDQLPACLETVNPKLPLVAEYYKLPVEAGVNTLPLSNVEQRTATTKLYFEKTLPGKNVYSVLERVAVAGTFHWPGTQLRPMYDNRFFGFSDPTIVYCVE
jgi:alpha-2-macroglobulin